LKVTNKFDADIPNWIDDLLFFLKTEVTKPDAIYDKIKILGVNEENHERYKLLYTDVSMLGV
jgi:hypothetical protein